MEYFFRANLSSATYPFNFDDASRSTILMGSDQNFNRQVQSGADEDKDVGIAQAIFLQNVAPTAQGYKSILLNDRSSNFAQPLIWAQPQLATKVDGKQAFFVSDGVYTFPYPTLSSSFPDAQLGGTQDRIFATSLAGVNYFRLGSNPVTFEYTQMAPKNRSAMMQLQPQKLIFPNIVNGAPIGSSIAYLCAVGNRLCFFLRGIDQPHQTTVAWSSSLSPTDFDFSKGLITGAGYLTPHQLNSPIRYVIPHPLGAIIYTEQETVFMRFQASDAIRPFSFQEIEGVALGASNYGVAYGNPDKFVQYAITNNGVYEVTPSYAKNIFPDLDTYLRDLEFVTVTEDLQKVVRIKSQVKSIGICCDRYVCFSFGDSRFSNIAVIHFFDLTLKRWGQITVERSTPTRKIISTHFLNDTEFLMVLVEQDINTGFNYLRTVSAHFDSTKLLTASTGYIQANFPPLALFGKFQHVRGHYISIQALELENVKNAIIRCHSSLDGKNVVSSELLYRTDPTKADNLLGRGFLRNSIGTNHIISIQGLFDLNTLQLTYLDEGKTSSYD
jgi:hypothetical protein